MKESEFNEISASEDVKPEVLMTFIKDKAAFKTALLIFMTCGEEYQHIAELFLLKAYGR